MIALQSTSDLYQQKLTDCTTQQRKDGKGLTKVWTINRSAGQVVMNLQQIKRQIEFPLQSIGLRSEVVLPSQIKLLPYLSLPNNVLSLLRFVLYCRPRKSAFVLPFTAELRDCFTHIVNIFHCCFYLSSTFLNLNTEVVIKQLD